MEAIPVQPAEEPGGRGLLLDGLERHRQRHHGVDLGVAVALVKLPPPGVSFATAAAT